MTLDHPTIKNKIAEWQKELQALTGNNTLLLVAHKMPPVSIETEKIVAIVCEETGVQLAQLKHGSRIRENVTCRQALSYYLRTLTGMPYSRIGKLIGGRERKSYSFNESIHITT